jgi:hypothetical protein
MESRPPRLLQTRLTFFLPAHAMEDIPDLSTQPKKLKAASLNDILLKLGPITDVSYKPF